MSQAHTNIEEESNIYEIENESGFMIDALINVPAIRRTIFTLTEKHNFEQIRRLKDMFSRKNIIYFGKIFGEEPIAIENTKGNFTIPIINKATIYEKIKQMNEKDRTKIAYIHISTIQVILKSTYINCDTPIELEISDDRIIDKRESVIARGRGNLSQGLLKFDVNVQVGLSLKDKDLNKSITIRYEVLRRNFMNKGNHPFTVTYQINYALTNSHHSITFKTDDRIYVDKLFEPLLNLESPKLFSSNKQIERRKSTSETPSIWIPKIEKPISVVDGRTSFSDEIGETSEQASKKELSEIKEMIRSLSLRI